MARPTYDTVSSGSIANGSSQTLTVSHTTSGSNRGLLVGLSFDDDDGPNSCSGVTYAGTGMTRIVGAAGDSIQVYALADCATGANNVVMTQTQFLRAALVAVSVSDANIASFVASSSVSVTLSDSANVSDDQMLVSFARVFDFDQPAAPQLTATGTSQTKRVEVQQTWMYLAASTQATTASPVTASWTFGQANDSDSSAVVVLNGISAGGSVAFRPYYITG
jgi:hypothetical protein